MLIQLGSMMLITLTLLGTPSIPTAILAIGIGVAAVAVGAAMMQLASNQADNMGATGLANGGIIPSGYPNDSFPAMLSSNEAVIPLDKYEFNGGNTNINVQIEGVARGEDIYYVVKEVERKHKNSF
jgi:hypothetical protein